MEPGAEKEDNRSERRTADDLISSPATEKGHGQTGYRTLNTGLFGLYQQTPNDRRKQIHSLEGSGVLVWKIQASGLQV